MKGAALVVLDVSGASAVTSTAWLSLPSAAVEINLALN